MTVASRYKNYTAAADEVLATKPVTLVSVVLNKAVANAVIIIHDSNSLTTARPVHTFTLPAVLLQSQAVLVTAPLALVNGLRVQITGAPDVTVTYNPRP